jgi:hypothetical protein
MKRKAVNVRKFRKEDVGWLLHFKKPNASVFENLRYLLAKCNVSSFKKTTLRNDKNVTFDGSLEDLITVLSRIIETDYSNNKSEKDVPWKFDYVVMEDKQYGGAIQVLTRLYSPTKKLGNIFYGRHIKRIDANRYLMWIDD